MNRHHVSLEPGLNTLNAGNFVITVTQASAVGCTQVKLHDYGCSLKAYRASLVSSIRLYGEMHRFIPALAAMEGAAICELEV